MRLCGQVSLRALEGGVRFTRCCVSSILKGAGFDQHVSWVSMRAIASDTAGGCQEEQMAGGANFVNANSYY